MSIKIIQYLVANYNGHIILSNKQYNINLFIINKLLMVDIFHIISSIRDNQ